MKTGLFSPRTTPAGVALLVLFVVWATSVRAESAPEPVHPAPEELAAIQAALGQDATSAPKSTPPATVPVRAGGSVQSLNPDISLIGDFAFAAFSREENHQTGGHDPVATGFNLQQLELSLSSAVDPYFRFDSYLVFGRDGFELEEAYGTTLALPGRLQVRAGQFLTRFGRLNPTHPHSWNFVDQPFALGRVFGGDGNRALGAELSYLTPLPWYVELVVSAMRADGEGTNRSFLAADERVVKGPRDLLYVAALKQFFELSADWSFALGFSGAFGPNPSSSRSETQVFGADLFLKYRPLSSSSYTSLSLQSEWLYRRRELGPATLHDVGGYTELVYRFAQRFSAAGRYEYGTPAFQQSRSSVSDPLDPSWTRVRTRHSLALTHYPSEFSRIRWQGSSDTGLGRPVLATFLAVEFVIGAHGAHPF